MTSLTPINPSDAPRPVGGNSQAVGVTGASELLFVSRQIPEMPDGAFPDEFPEQCRSAWANVTASPRAAGLGIEDLVKVTIYLTARSSAEVNRAVRKEFLGDHRPALTVVVIETLDPRWLLELEAIATR